MLAETRLHRGRRCPPLARERLTLAIQCSNINEDDVSRLELGIRMIHPRQDAFIEIEILIISNPKERPRDPDARSPSMQGAPLHVKLNPIYKLLKLYNIYYRPLLTTSHKHKCTHSHNTTLIYTPSPTLRQPHVYLQGSPSTRRLFE
jgi:hypothetical protein